MARVFVIRWLATLWDDLGFVARNLADNSKNHGDTENTELRSNPGSYDRKITIQQHDGTTDELGELDRSEANWDDYDTTYARPMTRGGKQFFKADAVHGEVSEVIEIPWSPAAALITRSMRVKYDGRLLNIAAVIDVDNRHEQMQLHCTEDT